MKKYLAASIILLLQTGAITSQRSQDPTKFFKQKVDGKADSLKSAIAELKVAVNESQAKDDKVSKPEIRYVTKWRTKWLPSKPDTVFKCPPVDSTDYSVDEPEVILKHDTTQKILHDTLYLKKRPLIRIKL